MTKSLYRRAQIYAALGDPVRLAIVEDLAHSDRSPKELGTRFELASNLVAHHLEVLDSAGLIERLVSEGDRRRRYIRLISTSVAGLGIGCGDRNGRALFVCSHNSARSQLAAALWRKRTGNDASSAGTHPASRVDPGAVATGKRLGLDLGHIQPRALSAGETADVVVTVCDQAHEELEPSAAWLHWSIPDPVAKGTQAAFDLAAAELDARISRLSQ